MIPSDLWNELSGKAGAPLSDMQHQSLWRFIDLLLAANQRMNLTRIASRDEAAVLHVGDALTLLPFIPQSARRLADVGSGGGVPGIPLAIARPDAQVVLIESTRKKAEFLRQTVATLGLANAAIDARRAEQVGLSDQRESFDIAIARALATLDWLAEWCMPLVKVGGSVLAMKGPRVHDELPGAHRAIRLLGGGEPVLHPVELPGAAGHVIVQIPKISRTDLRYPRNPTVAKRTPLR
jgi:16S rRNA (guanine527-N7)-methyltransferase